MPCGSIMSLPREIWHKICNVMLVTGVAYPSNRALGTDMSISTVRFTHYFSRTVDASALIERNSKKS